MKINILDSLNEAQKKAVTYTSGPSIILAGAGSGKTRVLTHKVKYLIEEKNVSPESIVMVTFTNKAAGEMKNRVGKPLGFIGTFHSLCAGILRRHGPSVGLDHNFVIYDEDDKQGIIKELGLQNKGERKFSPSFIASRISSAKDNLLNPQQYAKLASSQFERQVAEIYALYQKKLERSNAVDFDDLLFKAVVLLKENHDILSRYQNSFRYLLIDEFQDTNFAQYKLARLLSEKYKNITVVGDFSQSIYSWRGADLKNLKKFERDFSGSKTFYLEENYRSTQNILDFAYNVIEKNSSHPILKLHTKNTAGEEVSILEFENEQEEAVFIAETADRIIAQSNEKNQVAVLYRINALSRVIEEALLHYGIPYTLVGGVRFYARAEIKDILSYIRLCINSKDEVSQKRVLKIGKGRYTAFNNWREESAGKIDSLTTEKLMESILQITKYLSRFDEHDEDDLARLENLRELKSVAAAYPSITDFLERVALVESEYSENEKKKEAGAGVTLMTLHACKGLEFKHVFITALEEGVLPHSRSFYDESELEEERRLFYVGATRAEEKLFITHARRRFLFGRRIPSEKSRFIRGDDDYYAKTF